MTLITLVCLYGLMDTGCFGGIFDLNLMFSLTGYGDF